MTKEVLAALYVREALVGREYWVQDLRSGKEPELSNTVLVDAIRGLKRRL